VDREIPAHVLQQRHDEAAPGRPGHRPSPVLEVIVELVFMAVPGSAGHAKSRAPAAGSDHESSADRR
jgi:hypothetical protein